MSDPASRKVELVDLICGYTCNSGCIFCALDDSMRSHNLSPKAALERLALALEEHRPAAVRFGGGEPTIRKDLPRLISHARAAGVQTISVQTNGYVLANAEYLAHLVDSGLTKVNISYRSTLPRRYSWLTRVEKAHELATAGLRNCLAAGLDVEIDALLTTELLAEAAEIVAFLEVEGVRHINFWHVSHEGRALAHAELVPRFTAVREVLTPVFEGHPRMNLRVFYVPYCAFPEHRAWVWNPVEENTLVITPADRFMLEKGTIDIGEKTPRCEGCSLYDTCPGVRANYLALHGDEELEPVSS